MHWNEIQKAELESRRDVVATYQSRSKARGVDRTIRRKTVVKQPWKEELVRRTIECKKKQGAGRPQPEEEDYESEEEIIDLFQALLLDSEDEDTAED